MFEDLFHYETPEDGGGEPADEPIDVPDEGGDAGDAAGAAEAAAWALSQDDWQQTQTYLQQTAPILQAVAQMLPQLQQMQQAPQEPAAQGPELDPFDPDSVQNYIQSQIQSGLQAAVGEQLGPYEQMLSMQAAEQGEQLARQELEKIEKDIGKFDQDTAFLIAAGAIEGGQDPIYALRAAATYASEWEKRIRTEERAAYQEELKNLRTAPGEVPVGSSAATEIQPVPTGPRRYHEIVERYQARQNASPLVG
jgi:hypothetical protein